MAGLTTELAVCGLHRLGQPLNNQLKDLGAVYVKTCWSSPEYRMYVLPSPKKVGFEKPGMVYVTDGSGKAIELEIWQIEVDKLGHFMLQVPWPLAIGTVRLEENESCLGFVAEGWIANDPSMKEITKLGSWLQYQQSPDPQ